MYDPEGMVNVEKYFTDLTCADSAIDAIKDAEAIIIITEWEEFKSIDLDKAKSLLKTPIIVDLRNILNPEYVRMKGFTYHSVGKKGEK